MVCGCVWLSVRDDGEMRVRRYTFRRGRREGVRGREVEAVEDVLGESRARIAARARGGVRRLSPARSLLSSVWLPLHLPRRLSVLHPDFALLHSPYPPRRRARRPPCPSHPSLESSGSASGSTSPPPLVSASAQATHSGTSTSPLSARHFNSPSQQVRRAS